MNTMQNHFISESLNAVRDNDTSVLTELFGWLERHASKVTAGGKREEDHRDICLLVFIDGTAVTAVINVENNSVELHRGKTEDYDRPHWARIDADNHAGAEYFDRIKSLHGVHGKRHLMEMRRTESVND